MDEENKKQEETKKSKFKFNWKIAIPVLAVMMVAAGVCLFLLLRGRETVEPPPVAYAVGETEFPALQAPEGEEVQWTEDADGVFTYTGLTSSGSAAGDYINSVVTDHGFSVVDEEYIIQEELPDFTTAEGSVQLAREADEEGMLYAVSIDWLEGSCTVQVTTPEGIITEPEEEESEGRTLTETLDYVKSLDPALLGLEGESMTEYEVYAMSGSVIVDGAACLRIKVCSNQNPQQTNDLCGVYLFSSDGAHLYRLDEVSGTVEELYIAS